MSTKNKTVRRLLIVALALCVLLAAAWLVLFRVNRFYLEITLEGESTVVLPYGEAYQEPGVEVRFYATLFQKEGTVPETMVLTVDGEVGDALGRYTLVYRASYGLWTTEAKREVCVVDLEAPVIVLTQDPDTPREPGQIYQEAGFTATDNHDGDITDRVVRTEAPGIITYAVTDSSGNPTVIQREVPYHDPVPPEIELEGGEYYAIPTGTVYAEPGYSAQDDVDGDLTAAVSVEGEVNWLKPGIYPVVYTVTDSYQNVTTVTRHVEVTAAERPETVWPEEKTVYLTFDDGPGPYTLQLLDILDKYGVKATFFVVHTDSPEIMKEIVARGHAIGIHSVTHDYAQIYASPEAYFADLHQMQAIIYEHTGVWTTLMRFPGGSSNTVSCKICPGIMTLLDEAVQSAGFQYFDWNVDSGDAGGATKKRKVIQNVIEGIRQLDIAVVLQHDIHPYSVSAVEEIILWCLENGYTFAPLTPNSPGVHHDLNN